MTAPDPRLSPNWLAEDLAQAERDFAALPAGIRGSYTALPGSAPAPAYVDGKPAQVLSYDPDLGRVVDTPEVADLIRAYKRLGGLLSEAEAALATARSKLDTDPTDAEIEMCAEAAWEECRAQIKADPTQGVEIGPWSAVPPHHAAKGRAETRAALAAFLARRRG